MLTTIYKQNTFLYNTEKCCYQEYFLKKKSYYIVIHLFFFNCPAACSVVEEVMLQEAFNLPSTRILSLYALGNYLATRPQLSVSVPTANIQYFSHLFSKWKISFIWKRQMTETDHWFCDASSRTNILENKTFPHLFVLRSQRSRHWERHCSSVDWRKTTQWDSVLSYLATLSSVCISPLLCVGSAETHR